MPSDRQHPSVGRASAAALALTMLGQATGAPDTGNPAITEWLEHRWASHAAQNHQGESAALLANEGLRARGPYAAHEVIASEQAENGVHTLLIDSSIDDTLTFVWSEGAAAPVFTVESPQGRAVAASVQCAPPLAGGGHHCSVGIAPGALSAHGPGRYAITANPDTTPPSPIAAVTVARSEGHDRIWLATGLRSTGEHAPDAAEPVFDAATTATLIAWFESEDAIATHGIEAAIIATDGHSKSRHRLGPVPGLDGERGHAVHAADLPVPEAEGFYLVHVRAWARTTSAQWVERHRVTVMAVRGNAPATPTLAEDPQ